MKEQSREKSVQNSIEKQSTDTVSNHNTKHQLRMHVYGDTHTHTAHT